MNGQGLSINQIKSAIVSILLKARDLTYGVHSGTNNKKYLKIQFFLYNNLTHLATFVYETHKRSLIQIEN
jgi:hypothetical protein